MKTKKISASALSALRNDCYDMLIADWNRNSKFYSQDCEDVWKGLLKKDETELRTMARRWRAIRNVSEKEMALHCQV